MYSATAVRRVSERSACCSNFPIASSLSRTALSTRKAIVVVSDAATVAGAFAVMIASISSPDVVCSGVCGTNKGKYTPHVCKSNPMGVKSVTDTVGDVKARLRQRMEELGMSAPALAERTGDSPGNVKNWVQRETAVPADFLGRFVSAVPTNAEWLLTGRGTSTPWSADRARLLSDLLAEIFRTRAPEDQLNERLALAAEIIRSGDGLGNP